MAPPLLLLFGAGARIGAGIAQKFSAQGFKVAVVSRSGKAATGTEYLDIKADLFQPEGVKSIFEHVKSSLGIPTVVVYVAAGLTPASDDDPLSPPLDKFTSDLTINAITAYATAQEAVKGFKELGSDAGSPKTFIQIGNALNKMVMPALITLGVGKQATAHTIASAAKAYGAQGYHFYYVDERNEDGSPAMGQIDGPAHGEFCWELAQKKEQGPWDATFVKGKGYKAF